MRDLRSTIDNGSFESAIECFLKRIADTLEEAREINAHQKDLRKEQADKDRISLPQLKVGDLVLVRQHALSSARTNITAKLLPRFDGPYRIAEINSPTSYTIRANKHNGLILGKCHRSALQPYTGEDQAPVRPIRRRGRPGKLDD